MVTVIGNNNPSISNPFHKDLDIHMFVLGYQAKQRDFLTPFAISIKVNTENSPFSIWFLPPCKNTSSVEENKKVSNHSVTRDFSIISSTLLLVLRQGRLSLTTGRSPGLRINTTEVLSGNYPVVILTSCSPFYSGGTASDLHRLPYSPHLEAPIVIKFSNHSINNKWIFDKY